MFGKLDEMKSTEISTNWTNAHQNPLYQRLNRFYAFLETQQGWVYPKNFLKINIYHSSVIIIITFIDLINVNSIKKIILN